MTDNTQDSTQDSADLEISLEPESPKRRVPRTPVVLVLLGLVGLLLAGAYLATSDGDSELDVASDDVADVEVDDDETDREGEEDASSGEPDGDTDVTSEGGSEDEEVEARDDALSERALGEEFAAADSAYFGDGGGAVIYSGGTFVSLGYSEDGQTIRTSTDGITWDEKPFPGLPANSNVSRLAEHDGTVVALVEQWTEPDHSGGDDELAHIFGTPISPTHYLASTTNFATWDFVELPGPDLGDQSAYVNLTGLALNESGVVVLSQTQEQGEDELRILFDAGILDEATIENYCGIDATTPGSLAVQLCDFEDDESFWREFEEALEAAETDEERAEVERRFDEEFVEPEPEVIATIESGDPLYERLSSLYDTEERFPEIEALFGPIEGPFTRSPISQVGYPGAMTDVDGSFVAVLQRWAEGPEDRSTATVIRSTDGITWSEAGVLPSHDLGQLFDVDGVLVSVGGGEEGKPEVYVSDDLGSSWTTSTLSTALYNAYPQGVHGPAGVALLVQGGVEPYPEFEFGGSLTMTKDGFTLTRTFGESGGQVTLTGPDGAEIYALSERELYDDGNETIVRFGRLSGNQTFLDPVTGDDLVTFTSRDIEEAYQQIEPAEPEEIERRFELSFSSDGTTWTLIDDPRLDIDDTQSSLELYAVGDDELIVRKHTWTNPPAELFAFEEEGREPTGEEGRALDEWFEANEGQQVEYLRIGVS